MLHDALVLGLALVLPLTLVTAYRLSLLALIGDPESAEMRGRVADLARLPLGVAISHDYETVAHEEVAQISRGVLTPSPENTASTPAVAAPTA